MFKGYLTYTGIIVGVTGGLRIPDYLGVTPTDWNSFISVVLVIAGAIVAGYGRLRATRK